MLIRAKNAVARNVTENFDLNNDRKIDNIIFAVKGASEGWNDILWPHQAAFPGGTWIQFPNGETSSSYNLIMVDNLSHLVTEGGSALTEDWSYAEPSGGAGAVAVLVSDKPYIYQADVGANGYYGFEVMDTCRPIPDSESGNSDLSLLSYLDCCEQAFKEYQKRVASVSYKDSF